VRRIRLRVDRLQVDGLRVDGLRVVGLIGYRPTDFEDAGYG